MIKTNLDSVFVDDDLMEAGFNQSTAQVLELLPGLHEEVPPRRREFDGDTFACIACPNMQTWVARSSMDGEEVEIGVEASKDSVCLIVLDQVRCGGGK